MILETALFKNESVGQTAAEAYDFTKLRVAFADLDEAPGLNLFCLTDLAARFRPVNRDFTTITCARRRRWGGGPPVAGVRDRGDWRRLSGRAGGAA